MLPASMSTLQPVDVYKRQLRDYRSGSAERLPAFFERFGTQEMLRFLEENGLYVTDKNAGRRSALPLQMCIRDRPDRNRSDSIEQTASGGVRLTASTKMVVRICNLDEGLSLIHI